MGRIKNGNRICAIISDSSSSSSSYVVAVKTGNFVGAGTDAKVFVMLFGDKGETEKLALDISNQLNKFELGQVDEFDLQAKDIGKVGPTPRN